MTTSQMKKYQQQKWKQCVSKIMKKAEPYTKSSVNFYDFKY